MITISFSADSMTDLISQMESAVSNFKKPKSDIEDLRRRFTEKFGKRKRFSAEERNSIESGEETETSILTKSLGIEEEKIEKEEKSYF